MKADNALVTAFILLIKVFTVRGIFERLVAFEQVVFTNESNIDRWKNSRQKAIDSKIGRLEGFMNVVNVPMQVLFFARMVNLSTKCMHHCRKSCSISFILVARLWAYFMFAALSNRCS